jgi:hypothetical protein
MDTSRWILAVVGAIVVLGAIPAEINRAHVFNPEWPPHAKFHAATYAVMNLAAGLAAEALLWVAPRVRVVSGVAAGLLAAVQLALLVGCAFPGASARAEGEPVLLRVPIALWIALALLALTLVAGARSVA